MMMKRRNGACFSEGEIWRDEEIRRERGKTERERRVPPRTSPDGTSRVK